MVTLRHEQTKLTVSSRMTVVDVVPWGGEGVIIIMNAIDLMDGCADDADGDGIVIFPIISHGHQYREAIKIHGIFNGVGR